MMSKIINFTRNNKINIEKSILFFSFIQRLLMGISASIIGPIIPLIATDLRIGLDYIGSTISIGTFILLVTVVGVGFLLELFGFKKIIFSGSVLAVLSYVGLLFSHSYGIFIIAYSVLQLGVGTMAVATLSLVGNLYFKNKAKSILISNTGFVLGSVIAPLLVSLIVSINMKWQVLFLYLIIPQVFLILLLIFLKIPGKDNVTKNLKGLFNANKNVASHPYIILCGFITFLYVSVMQTFYTWFTSYFSALDIKLGASSLILAIYATATLVGMFIKNYVVKYMEEKRLLLAGISLSFIFLLSVFFTPNLIVKIVLIFLFGVNVAGNFSLTFSMGLNIGSRFTNMVSSLLHAFSYLGVILFQYLSGYLSEHFSKNSVLYIDLTLLLLLIIVVSVMNKRELRYLSRDINVS